MYVCICLYMYVCMCIYEYILYICMYVCTVCMKVLRLYAYTYVCKYASVSCSYTLEKGICRSAILSSSQSCLSLKDNAATASRSKESNLIRHTYIHTYEHTWYIHLDTHKNLSLYKTMYVCMYVCMHVHMYDCLFE